MVCGWWCRGQALPALERGVATTGAGGAGMVARGRPEQVAAEGGASGIGAGGGFGEMVRILRLRNATSSPLSRIASEDFIFFPKERRNLRLALLHGIHQLGAVALVFEDFFAIEPMLDVIAADNDPATVPISGLMQLFVRGGREDSVKSRGAPGRSTFQAIGMMHVIDDLILVSRRFGADIPAGEVEDATEGRSSQLELKVEFKVGELLPGDDVAAGDCATLLDASLAALMRCRR